MDHLEEEKKNIYKEPGPAKLPYNTVEPRYKEVGYITKPSYNKVILLVPALYISFVFFTLT